ncbi:MAG: VOC family protein [Xanthomonadales bacterium]|jgi:catechol 2,3-dioxygenase-like lactoylglutathione lyase family enzyme|nr:VOC family protein [Xanthomonadales bacterium]
MKAAFATALLWTGLALSPGAGAQNDPVTGDAAEVERLAPLHRTSLLVADLERSLTLYRDILGLEVGRVSDTPPDSYSYRFFNIEPGAMKRFAYLSGEDGYANVLGLGEVPGIELNLPESPRSAAYVQTVADVEGVREQVEALGLETIPPVEFMSREAGKPGMEFGIIDFDGHLILVYGLLRPTP